ncbi:hypothetical protein G9A89_022892 [Geosiphon pyriformis]|nr:hypothetical protein G9A89_022892 [Geosiphon pyriformis]
MNQWISEELKKMDIDRLVVPYFRVSICDYSGSSMDDRCKATLTMWRPDENLYSNIKEGGRYLIHNVTTPNWQTYPLSPGTPMRLNSMGHSILWKEALLDPKKLGVSMYKPRSITSCSDLWKAQNHLEVDLVVCVLVVSEPRLCIQANGKEILAKTMLVTDNSQQLTLIECTKQSFTELIKPMCIVFFKNLRYRKCEFEFGVHFLATNPETEIKVSPREIYAQETITDLKQWVKNNKPTLDELQSTAVEICGPLLDKIYYLK